MDKIDTYVHILMLLVIIFTWKLEHYVFAYCKQMSILPMISDSTVLKRIGHSVIFTLLLYFRGGDTTTPKVSTPVSTTKQPLSQSADELYRRKLEMQNEHEENLETFQDSLKREEEHEREQMKSKHQLNMQSKL